MGVWRIGLYTTLEGAPPLGHLPWNGNLCGSCHPACWRLGARRYRVLQESTMWTLFWGVFWGWGITDPAILEDRTIVGTPTVSRALLLDEVVTAVLHSFGWNLCPACRPLWVFPLAGAHSPFGLPTFRGPFGFVPLKLSRWPRGLSALGFGWPLRGVRPSRTFVSLLSGHGLVDLPRPEQSVLA